MLAKLHGSKAMSTCRYCILRDEPEQMRPLVEANHLTRRLSISRNALVRVTFEIPIHLSKS